MSLHVGPSLGYSVWSSVALRLIRPIDSTWSFAYSIQIGLQVYTEHYLILFFRRGARNWINAVHVSVPACAEVVSCRAFFGSSQPVRHYVLQLDLTDTSYVLENAMQPAPN